MLKIKSLMLKNYSGFKNKNLFSFTKEDGSFNPLNMFFGPNGCGKCVTGSTFIVTEQGQICIKDVFANKNLIENTWYTKDFLVGINGNLGKVNKIYFNGKKKTTKITTCCGYTLEGSSDLHKILSITDNGKIDFIKQSNLKTGDKVIISRKSFFPEKCDINENIAIILGYLISEGSCFQHDCGFRFYNSDKEILENFISKCDIEFNSKHNYIFYESNGNNGIVRLNQKNSKYLEKYGIKRVLSGEKTIPFSILQGNKSVICSFLRSYFEGDGHVSNQIIGCDSKSYQLIHEIQLLLLRLGIISSVHKKYIKKLSYTDKEYTSWRLVISGENIDCFAKEIGFISSRKISELDELLIKRSLTKTNPNKDIIPTELWIPVAKEIKNFISNNNIKFSKNDYKNSKTGLHCLQSNYINMIKNGISREKIEACISSVNLKIKSSQTECSIATSLLNILDLTSWWKEDYFFDSIESIEYGEEDLFDICVEDEHCYWSNGFISHNTTGLNAIAVLSRAKAYSKRGDKSESNLLLRKMQFHPDYDPNYSGFTKYQDEMEIVGTFWDGTKDLIIHVKDDDVIRNDLFDRGQDNCVFIDADHPISMSKFQIPAERIELFLDLATTIYGYKCYVEKAVSSDGVLGGNQSLKETLRIYADHKDKIKGMPNTSNLTRQDVYDAATESVKKDKEAFYQDFIIEKGEVKVHYKSMSAGEKKIATLLRSLCDPTVIDKSDIVMVDNIEMHVYFKRHKKMIDKLIQSFPEKQFIVTSHSGIMIDHVREAYGENCLYDISVIKGQPLVE